MYQKSGKKIISEASGVECNQWMKSYDRENMFDERLLQVFV